MRHYRLLAHRLLHHGLIGDGALHGAMLGGKGGRVFPRNGNGSILPFTGRSALAVPRMTGLLPIRLVTLLI